MTEQILKFDEAAHRYTDAEGSVYTSVTTLLSNYKEKYDKEYWSTYKALEKVCAISKRRLSPQPQSRTYIIDNVSYTISDVVNSKTLNLKPFINNIINDWQQITDEACERGTNKHLELETYIKGFIHPKVKGTKISEYNYSAKYIDEKQLSETELQFKYPLIYKYLVNAINKGYVIYTEYRLSSKKHKIAGTSDIVLIKDKKCIILDWKTNKEELYQTSGYYKKIKVLVDGKMTQVKTNTWIATNKKMLYPVEHLEECKYNDYTLQLSMYGKLVEMLGFECVGLVLCHIRSNATQEWPPVFYTPPYLKLEVENILDHHIN
jgi:hypothetical protein